MGDEEGRIDLVVTYLEMTAPPTSPPPPPLAVKHALLRAERPPVSFYRYLYSTVGDPWLWYERRAMDDAHLAEIIHHDDVAIYVLYVGGVPAGFSELDRRRKPEVELAYFGLTPEFMGRGLGAYLLRWTVDEAWARQPHRLRVNTCNLALLSG